MRIDYKQKFHPVGQGLFYTSSLEVDSSSVNIVFDCGSENEKEIEEKVKCYEVENIDILIISHLHFDHISGLNKLLEKRHVDTVVLPYLFPEERSSLLLQFINEINDNEWYGSFLSNPYLYLSKIDNIGKIVIISSGNENDEDYQSPQNDFLKFDKEKEFRKKAFINIENLNKEKADNICKIDNLLNISKCDFRTNKGFIKIGYLYYSFFNYKISDKAIQDFRSKLNKETIFSMDDALSDLKNNVERKLIRVYGKIKRSKGIKENYHVSNLTSLAVYQGLVLPNNFKHIDLDINDLDVLYNMQSLLLCNEDFDGFSEFYCRHHISSIPEHRIDSFRFCEFYTNDQYSYHIIDGTLLLGDIKLDYKEKHKKLFNHFGRLLSTVRLVQLSHHGAINGWNDELMNITSNYCMYIASHGNNNNYNHPDKDVLLKLAKNKKRYISVTESNEFENRLNFNLF